MLLRPPPMGGELDDAGLIALPNRQHVHDQTDEYVLVLGIGFGDQQRQCGKADVVNDRLAIPEQPAVAVQEIHKQERTVALVAVQKPLTRHPWRAALASILSANGWFLMTKYSRCAALDSMLG